MHFIKESYRIDIKGAFIDTHHISCKTPDLKHIGCGEVEIEISIGDYRAEEKLVLNIYANTDPNRCIVFGMCLYKPELRVSKEHEYIKKLKPD